MHTLIQKSVLSVLIVLFVSLVGNAQDVIVKNDKTEIKSKVIEITETSIKYKKWENQSGPLYNISINDVFMIIYANGQREIIKSSTPAPSPAPAPAPAPATTTQHTSNSIQAQLAQTQNTSRTTSYATGASNTAVAIDTSVNYKNTKVKYAPGRLVVWLADGPLTIGGQSNVRLVKNFLNFGVSWDFAAENDFSYNTYGFYLSPYLAVNRLTGAYEKQDKGIFLFTKVGYGYTSVSYKGKSSPGGDGVLLGAGIDILFTRSFGINGSLLKIGQGKGVFQTGLTLNF